MGWWGLPSQTPGILRPEAWPSTKANKRIVRESHKQKANRTRCRDCHRPRLLIFSSRRRIRAAQQRKATHRSAGGRLPIFLPLLRTTVDGSRARGHRLCYYHQLTNQPFGDRGDGLGGEDGGGIVADDGSSNRGRGPLRTSTVVVALQTLELVWRELCSDIHHGAVSPVR
uniref:DUF834 domain-containing protein n=1 Tax=Oryza rufipogon TaxID=4529 RepID=A0A0E0RGR5_ORYRU